MLFGGFLAAAFALGQKPAVAPDADGELLVVVGAGLAGDFVFQHGAGVLLHDLLQTGLVVVLGGLALGDEGQDEVAGGLHAAVQIQCGNDGLERVRHDAGPVAAAAQILAVAQAQVLAQVDFLGKLEEQYGKTELEALLKGRGRQIRISMTYYPDINEYMGKKTPQIVVTHYR